MAFNISTMQRSLQKYGNCLPDDKLSPLKCVHRHLLAGFLLQPLQQFQFGYVQLFETISPPPTAGIVIPYSTTP